jgi:hypothetical protein
MVKEYHLASSSHLVFQGDDETSWIPQAAPPVSALGIHTSDALEPSLAGGTSGLNLRPLQESKEASTDIANQMLLQGYIMSNPERLAHMYMG